MFSRKQIANERRVCGMVLKSGYLIPNLLSQKPSLSIGLSLRSQIPVTFSRPRPYTRTMITDDMALLREYAARHSEEAFATLVSRHINLVYSVALRRLGDP